MAYRVKRIDPYWHANPIIMGILALGVVLGLVGYRSQQIVLAGIGAVLVGVAVFLSTKVVVSAVVCCLGVFGGLMTFVLVPNPQIADMGLGWRLLSTTIFALLYMVLMDALLLVVAALYNFFGGAVGLGGIDIDLEGGEET